DASCDARPGSHEAGISSTPISSSNSRSMNCLLGHCRFGPRPGNGHGELADAQDVSRALCHADAAARIKQVEQMGTLEAVVEGGQDEPRIDERAGKVVVPREEVAMKGRELALGQLHLSERVFRLLDL